MTDVGIGELLMSATFVTDLCTALALSAIFVKPNIWFPVFLLVSLALILALPRIASWSFGPTPLHPRSSGRASATTGAAATVLARARRLDALLDRELERRLSDPARGSRADALDYPLVQYSIGP
jgi:hypothetical protein